jgi:hypothetical protein
MGGVTLGRGAGDGRCEGWAFAAVVVAVGTGDALCVAALVGSSSANAEGCAVCGTTATALPQAVMLSTTAHSAIRARLVTRTAPGCSMATSSARRGAHK